MSRIYVMAIDHGTEGHSPPVQAFETWELAKAALAIATANAMGCGWKVYCVPVWPENAELYLNIKAVAP